MTSPANEMHIFLWQIGTVIPIQSMITHIYMPYYDYSYLYAVAKTLLQRAESLPSNSDSQANELQSWLLKYPRDDVTCQ